MSDVRQFGCDVLFVCYGGGHVNLMVPVIQQLARQSPCTRIRVLGLTSAQRVLEANGIDYLRCSDFMRADDAAAHRFGQMLAAETDTSFLGEEESRAYLGLSFRDLVNTYGEQQAFERYKHKGRQAFLPVNFLTEVIESLEPTLVVATSAPRAERAAILAASKLGLPSIVLVDLFAMAEVEWLKDNEFATRVCVISQAVADRLTRHGRMRTHIRVTGNPAFDDLAAPGLAKEAKKLRVERGWDNKFVVLFASQAEPDIDAQTGEQGDTALPDTVERYVCGLARALTDLKFAVRRHPNQPAVPISEQEPAIYYSPHDEPLGMLLHAVDCVVTFSSTVGLQGALIGKPLIAVSLSITSKNAPYATLGMAIGVDALDELEAAIDQAMASAGRQLDGLPSPGGAAGRIVDEIMSLMPDPGEAAA